MKKDALLRHLVLTPAWHMRAHRAHTFLLHPPAKDDLLCTWCKYFRAELTRAGPLQGKMILLDVSRKVNGLVLE